MKTRRAILVNPGRFEIEEATIEPRNGEVLVKVSVCGMCTWELNHWHGILGSGRQTLGHEYGGTIVDVSDAADRAKIGMRVTGLPDGLIGFADYALFRKNEYFPVNDDIADDHLIGEPLKCIVTVVRAARPEAGDHGVVIGCGPMGIWCLQALSSRGLGSLIAVDLDPARLDIARRCGATHAVNPGDGDLRQAISSITGGHMADFVVEGTGLPTSLETGSRIVRRGRARMVLMSSHHGAAGSFDFRPSIESSLELYVAHPGYSLDPVDDMRRAADLLNRGVFRSHDLITHRFPLERVNEAFTTLENKPSGYLKGVVIP